MKRVYYARLSTEQRNPRSRRLDRLSAEQVVALMNREDRRVLRAVGAARPQIARAIEWIASALRAGGRLFFFGAGTSGRLGVIEAAECPPTFGTPPALIQAVMAGGRAAVFTSKEGAEDSGAAATLEVKRRVRKGDVVVGIAASGVTPFVRSALRAGRGLGAKAILVTCHKIAAVGADADLMIHLATGPEVLTGSTRLKAGSACKMALNMLTTGAMVRIGKVYGHWMVDLQPKSKKLVERGKRFIRELGGVPPSEAERLFKETGGRVKLAILMAQRGWSLQRASAAIDLAGGFLGRALATRVPAPKSSRLKKSRPSRS